MAADARAVRNPGRRALARIRQRLGRYDRAAARANAAGDWAKVEHYSQLLDRDVAHYEAATTAAAPAAKPSRAGEFTPAATVDLTDDQLLAACSALVDDPAAQEQIVATLEWREEAERQRDTELAEHREQQERERALAWEAAAAVDDASPLTTPGPPPSAAAVARSGVPRGVRRPCPPRLPHRGDRLPRADAHPRGTGRGYPPAHPVLGAREPGPASTPARN